MRIVLSTLLPTKDYKCARMEIIIYALAFALVVGVIQADSPKAVRLVGGQKHAGLVEVQTVDGLWRPMCWQLVTQIKDNTLFYWGIEEANVMCRMLGFKAAKNHHFFQPRNGSAKQWFTGVDCNGNEARISDCSNQGKVVQQCFQNRQTGVICENDEDLPTGNFRLRGGSSPNQGFAEMQIHGVWRGICSYGFHIQEANVLCRTLNYKGALTIHNIKTVDDDMFAPIWTKTFNCKGDETDIRKCNLTVPVEMCSLSSAKVACHSYPGDLQVRLVGGNATYYGKVEVKFNNTWGSICHMENANAICRMLNYTRALATLESFRGGPVDGKKWLSGLYCSGKETSLEQCDRAGWGDTRYCGRSSAGVICDDPSVKYPNVAVRLVDADGDAPNRGRVEVRYHGVWGTVSVFKWSKYYSKYEHNNVHHVICRLLGYKSGIKFELVRTNGKGPLLMSNVDCSGNETSIEQCSHRGWGETSYRNYELEVHCEDGS